ncbi:MAG: glycosyltransferase [Candidatus Rokubacteria bacterium]|nr:glycosyltransferase [Candidatus Rokubacteria bacterium]
MPGLDHDTRRSPLALAAGATGRRPRIAQVIPSLRVGGLEKVVLRLVESLGDPIEHLVVTPSGDGPLREDFPRGVRVVAMSEHHPSDRWNALRMARLFRAFRPDIVHTRNWTCIDAVIGARLARVPVVVHGEHGRDAADPHGRNPLRRRVRRWLAPLVTEFVTVSRDLARWLIEEVGVPARKVTHLCNGVDTKRFLPGDRDVARRALGVPDGLPVVGTVGRLDPVKDHAGLIRVFTQELGRRAAILVIAGDGPARPQLAELVRTCGAGGRIRLLGERDDIPLVLRALDLFVLPSVGEGISNAILEAMATGLPVVATRVGGNPELVADGRTGWLVEPGSTAALAEAMSGYLDDPALARRHGRAARERVEREFSLERMLAGYADLYRRCLARVRIR